MNEQRIAELKAGFPRERSADLWNWLNSPREPNCDDFAPKDQMEFTQALALRLEQERTWGIYHAGELVGYFAFARQSPVCGQFHGLVIAPLYRGMGIGEAAVRAAIAELTGKLMVWTFADNLTIKRLFERVGFVEEGYLTGATRRNGKPLDIRVLAITKEN